MAVSGSLRKLLLDGIAFQVAGDANAAKTPKTTKEAVVHSGGNSIKIMKASGQVESVTTIVSPSEYETLEELANRTSPIPISYQQADGKTWVSNGHVNLDNYESEENRCDLTLIPEGNWDLF